MTTTRSWTSAAAELRLPSCGCTSPAMTRALFRAKYRRRYRSALASAGGRSELRQVWPATANNTGGFPRSKTEHLDNTCTSADIVEGRAEATRKRKERKPELSPGCFQREGGEEPDLQKVRRLPRLLLCRGLFPITKEEGCTMPKMKEGTCRRTKKGRKYCKKNGRVRFVKG